jgi:hypothetical protein
MNAVLLEHNQYDRKILIVNFEDEFFDFFKDNFFQDYELTQKIGGQNQLFYCLTEKLITIVLIDILSSDNKFGKGLKLFKIIKKLAIEANIIICSEIDNNEIKEHIPELNKDKIYYFEKKKVKSDTVNFLRTIQSIIGEALFIDDRWILKTLDQASGFESFGLKFRPFFYLIEDEISSFEDSEYSIWFNKLYDEIIKNRFSKIFETSRLEYIRDAIENFIWLERLSYIMPFYSREKRYRDHFLHQVRIAVLGNFFLDVYLDEKTKLIDYINSVLTDCEDYYKFTDFNNSKHKSTVKNCRVTWWVTALMHDYTYPLYSLFYPFPFNKNNKVELLKSFIPDFLDPFLISYNSTIKEFRIEFQKKLKSFLDEVNIDKRLEELILQNVKSNIDHNITGAFNLWHLQKKQAEGNEYLCTELACQSILLHHPFQEKESIESKSISFDKYPLAFLLILLDEIQDWGRPVILTDNQKDPTKIEKSTDLNEIEIKGLTKKKGDSDRWYFRDDKIVITMDYSKSCNIEPVLSDIIKSKRKNLKRLQIGGAKLPNILIRLIFKDWEPVEILIERRKI